MYEEKVIKVSNAIQGEDMGVGSSVSLRRKLINKYLTTMSSPLKAEMVQDIETILKEEREGLVDAASLPVIDYNGSCLSVWRGDITKLVVDGIVNAANEEMLGK
jgi:hypothetical protein